MRAWEPLPGELRGGGKAWAAFQIYRDLGPRRTLREAARLFYGCGENEPAPHQYEQLRRWSAKFGWLDRARALDSRDEMIRLEAREELQRERAESFAQREAAIEEQLLINREKAAKKAERLLDWPLAEQRVVREDEEEGEVTVIFMPSRWSLSAVKSLQEVAAGVVGGKLTEEELEETLEFDWSGWSEEEMLEYMRLYEKLSPKRPE